MSLTSVKAKFKCQSITDYGFAKEVKLIAVYSQEGENADFTKATPSGTLMISISNDTPANNFFKPQEDYYLTFDEAPKS